MCDLRLPIYQAVGRRQQALVLLVVLIHLQNTCDELRYNIFN